MTATTTTTRTTSTNSSNDDGGRPSSTSSPLTQAQATALNAALTRRRTTNVARNPLTPSAAASFFPQKFSVNDDDEDETTTIETTLLPVHDATYLWSSFVAGVGSGILASIVCAPLDVLRTRLQVWGDVSGSRASGIHVVKDIVAKEGWKGGFRGLGATLLTVPCFWGMYFPLYNDLKRRLQTPTRNTSLVHCVSAILAGGVADVVCNPMFVVRTRLQTEALHGTITPSGILQTAKALYTEGGPLVFWRGMTASLFGLTHVAVQFPLYEWLKHRAQQQQQQQSILTTQNHAGETNDADTGAITTPASAKDVLIASALSKMCASLLTYPHEVVRSRMMDARTIHTVSKTTRPPSLTKTMQRIYAHEGIHGFYTGLHISLLRVVPNCCITFLSYELLLQWAHRVNWNGDNSNTNNNKTTTKWT